MSLVPLCCRPASGNIPGVAGSSPGLLQRPWSLGLKRGKNPTPRCISVEGGDGNNDEAACGRAFVGYSALEKRVTSNPPKKNAGPDAFVVQIRSKWAKRSDRFLQTKGTDGYGET